MSVPDFQTIMLPMVRMLSDGKEYSLAEMLEHLGSEFALSEDDLGERIPSGRQTRFYNRICWSTTYLKKAGILENTKRGIFRITPRGREILQTNPERIDMKTLEAFPEYVEFRSKREDESDHTQVESLDGLATATPDELLEDTYSKIRSTLASDILEKIKSCSPNFFERLVVELLVQMGYGGTRQDAGQAIGRSGDGGIDGIIKEDRLGLDVIYIQAKRWEGNVSRPELQKFAGALLGKQARKGVFITTSSFTNEAKGYVESIGSNIILIDGDELADLMIDYNVGVSVAANYEIKKIDSDYFIEE